MLAPHINLWVLTAYPTQNPSVTKQVGTFVPFQNLQLPYGGRQSTITFTNGKVTSISARSFQATERERAAAATVNDAINGSGLLNLEFRPNDHARTPIGHTRIFLDNRSRFVEFPTDQLPAAAAQVVDAATLYAKKSA